MAKIYKGVEKKVAKKVVKKVVKKPIVKKTAAGKVVPLKKKAVKKSGATKKAKKPACAEVDAEGLCTDGVQFDSFPT